MKRKKRLTAKDNTAYFYLMSRTVNGEILFGELEKEVLRKMIWQVADFSGDRGPRRGRLRSPARRQSAMALG